MKKIWMLVGCVALAIVLTACSNKKDTVKTDAERFKEEYESINGTIREKDGKTIRTITIADDNPIVYATAEEIAEKIDNKETFAVYFGFKDCPWCRSIVPSLIESAKDLQLSTVYYVDVKEIRDTLEVKDGEVTTAKDGSDGYYQLLERLDNILNDYSLNDSDGNQVDTDEKRIYAPNIVIVKNGEAVEMTDGISEKQNDAYEELTDEMLSEMHSKIYNALSQIVSGAACSIDKAC